MAIVEVPCFIGDTLYHIGKKDKQVHSTTVRRILITRSGVWFILRDSKKGMVGRNLFLTEQEAKASMTFGERLKAERIRKGIALDEVAQVLGMTQNELSQIERDEISPSTGALIALAKYYGVSLDYLVGNVAAK